MDEIIDVVRLKRTELYSSAYQLLIESLFAQGQVSKRLRYAKWLFEENPALKSKDDLPIYICKVDGNYAGQLAIIPVEVMLAGNVIHGGWCVDYYVKPDFQRRGIGKKLLVAAHKDFPLLMTLGQTDASFELFLRLGWHYNDNRLILYKAFLRSSLLLKFFAKKIGLLKQNQAQIICSGKLKVPKESSIKEFDSFDEVAVSIDHLKRKNKPCAVIPRTLEFLEWRYISHPFIQYNKHKITVHNSYNIYIVWRLVHDGFWRCARIVDVLYKEDVPTSAMKAALNILKKYALFCGAEIFECQTNDPIVLKSLSDSHLSSKTPGKRFLYGMINMASRPLVPNDYWKLYAGDCDVDALSFSFEE